MKTAYVTEKKVHQEAARQGLTVEVIRPGGRANRYRIKDEKGGLLVLCTGAAAAMEWLERHAVD